MLCDQRVINLTPHEVTVWLDEDPMGEKASYPASGEVLRLFTAPVGEIRPGIGSPVTLVRFGDLKPREDGEQMAPRFPNTWYIVSLPCALAHPERDDFLAPFDEIRDGAGRIVGCRKLARVAALPALRRQLAESVATKLETAMHTSCRAVPHLSCQSCDGVRYSAKAIREFGEGT